MEIAELEERFAVPGVLGFETTSSGLVFVQVTAPAASATVYLHGAHLTDWQPAGESPVLFLSARTELVPGKPIRGGVPVIFPWFGGKADDKAAPAHGIARVLPWGVEDVRVTGGTVALTLSLHPSDATQKWWPHEFEARFTVTVGSSLEMSLQIRNTSPAAFAFEEALHTYFTVSDVRNVRVDGLSGTDYLDKVDGFKRKQQEGPVTISGETDRVYIDTTATCVLDDPGLRRRIFVEKVNSASTVVWNPWIAKAKAMADFGEEAWPGMICIETCNVGENRVNLPAGQTHQMKAILRSEG